MSLTLGSPKPLISIEKERVTKYMDARARVLVEHHDKSRDGLRTITMEWLDDAHEGNGGHKAGVVVRRLVRGDGRYLSGPKAFVLYDEAVISR